MQPKKAMHGARGSIGAVVHIHDAPLAAQTVAVPPPEAGGAPVVHIRNGVACTGSTRFPFLKLLELCHFTLLPASSLHLHLKHTAAQYQVFSRLGSRPSSPTVQVSATTAGSAGATGAHPGWSSTGC